MVIIRLSGGLGNQMFQYALYLTLTSKGMEVKLDDWTEYQSANARPIMLSVFGIDYKRASQEEVMELRDASLKLSHRIRRKIFGSRTKEYTERTEHFDEMVFCRNPAYLCGCFQSEQYFADIEKGVRKVYAFEQIQVPAALQEMVQRYKRLMRASDSVCIHMRRGDYLDADQVYGGICTQGYYQGAISYIKNLLPTAQFFIFSNDTDWAKAWCSKQKDSHCFTVVEGTCEENGYIDLMLMGACKHFIIANSSFSWWGAWLGKNKEVGSYVIAPKKWINTESSSHIYTTDMIKIDAEGNVQ